MRGKQKDREGKDTTQRREGRGGQREIKVNTRWRERTDSESKIDAQRREENDHGRELSTTRLGKRHERETGIKDASQMRYA